jgi:alpha-glucosidase
MDRDDQEMTEFNYRAAEMAAKYKLILDLHGTHKPAGLNRTYPNVLNFEGVFGLEQVKWGKPGEIDLISYDVMIPFIRQVAGPMDYTQGAMRNATKANYRACNSEPMSQGTRCHQLALYMILDSPFNMLCDTPSNYEREQECTDFISAVPTVWDETIVLDGKMGEYIITARRSGETWYIGGITNWDARDLEVDLSILGDKAYSGKLFMDGVNAHRIGRDYRSEAVQAKKGDKMKIHLAPGGGFALVLK